MCLTISNLQTITHTLLPPRIAFCIPENPLPDTAQDHLFHEAFPDLLGKLTTQCLSPPVYMVQISARECRHTTQSCHAQFQSHCSLCEKCPLDWAVHLFCCTWRFDANVLISGCLCLPLESELLERSGYARFISVLLKPGTDLAQKELSECSMNKGMNE